jgi:hypothetical protein
VNNSHEWDFLFELNVDLDGYYKKNEVYNKSEIDGQISNVDNSIIEVQDSLSKTINDNYNNLSLSVVN